jgi:predicted amidohydrolase YtcJ
VEPFDPWPGLALAVRREDARWPAGTPAYAPDQALTLDRALRANCVDPAASARELDRGRLTVGQRADVVVLAAAAIDEPVTPGGALATARPAMVLIDGEVVVDA